jgi:hypothetical protein
MLLIVLRATRKVNSGECFFTDNQHTSLYTIMMFFFSLVTQAFCFSAFTNCLVFLFSNRNTSFCFITSFCFVYPRAAGALERKQLARKITRAERLTVSNIQGGG